MKKFLLLKMAWLGIFCSLVLYLGIGYTSASAGQQATAVAEEKDEVKRKALLDRGRELFNKLDCASCHGVDGKNPASKEADFRLKQRLTYADIFKVAEKRVKSGAEDARAVAHFIKQLTEPAKQGEDRLK